jgi:hypothetical protein
MGVLSSLAHVSGWMTCNISMIAAVGNMRQVSQPGGNTDLLKNRASRSGKAAALGAAPAVEL